MTDAQPEKNPHFLNLERMYAVAPINDFYQPELIVEKGRARVSIDIEQKYFHAGGSLHGSVYFKLLDDAAYFAANSLARDFFLYTTSMTTQIVRAVTGGRLTAIGEVVQRSPQLFVADAKVYNEKNKLVAFGTGNFMKSGNRLDETSGYTGK